MSDRVEQVHFTIGEVDFHAHRPDEHIAHGANHMTTNFDQKHDI